MHNLPRSIQRMPKRPEHLQETVLSHAHKDFAILRQDLTVPTLFHALKLDPKIASGPVTLAVTDIATLLFYFTLASMMLQEIRSV